jgi:hypothetical protein
MCRGLRGGGRARVIVMVYFTSHRALTRLRAAGSESERLPLLAHERAWRRAEVCG